MNVEIGGKHHQPLASHSSYPGRNRLLGIDEDGNNLH